MIRHPQMAFAAVLAAACSTAEIQKVEMKAFTTSMSRSLDIVEDRIERLDLERRLKEDRHASVVAASGHYELGAGCLTKPSALLTDPETVSAPYLDERCEVTPRGPMTEPLALEPAPELDRAVAARRTSADLKAYVDAVDALISSDEPEQVAGKLASSLAALNDLAESAGELAGKEIPRNVARTVETGSTLAETLAREGLEAMRYRAVSAIVRDADPAVYEACLQLALWLADADDEALAREVEALSEAEVAAMEASVTRQDRATLDAALREFEARFDAVAKRDRNADWRVFLAAAQAHRALRDALDRPADIEAAARAQKRLDVLVRQTIAFVEAAEEL